MKKTIRLTGSDLTRLVKRTIKENKTNNRLTEGDDSLRDGVDDLSYELSDILFSMNEFIKKVDVLESSVNYSEDDDHSEDEESDYINQGISDLITFQEAFVDMLSKYGQM